MKVVNYPYYAPTFLDLVELAPPQVSMKGGSANNAKNPTPLILRASPTAPMPASRIRCKFPISTAEKKGQPMTGLDDTALCFAFQSHRSLEWRW